MRSVHRKRVALFKIIHFIRWLLSSRITFGARAERHAEKFLKKRGMRILARNIRTPRGEIDIVADDHGTLVIVEVRAQHEQRVKMPENSIRRSKRGSVLSAAKWYIKNRHLQHVPVRIDVVSVMWRGQGLPEITYYPSSVCQ